MSKKVSLASQLSSFEGVYCSGLFVPDPAITTALALLFERVHFLNHEEFVLEFAKESKIRIPVSEKDTFDRPPFP